MAFQNTSVPQAGQTPAANVAAVWTGAAPTDGSRWELDSILYSYSDAPPVGTVITIVSDTITMTFYVKGAGPGTIDFGTYPMEFAPNKQVVVTVGAGGGTLLCSVFPIGRTKN